MKLFYFFLGTLLFTFYSNAQTSVTLIASKDAAIGYHDGTNTANNNYGNAIQNAAYAIPSVAQSGGLNVNRALIDFNLSTIPVGATILSAPGSRPVTVPPTWIPWWRWEPVQPGYLHWW